MKDITQISEEDLRRYRSRFLRKVWQDIYLLCEKRAKEEGLTRKDIADRLGVHRSIITRRLNGVENVTLEIISDMSRALDAVPNITFEDYKSPTLGKNELFSYEPTKCFVVEVRHTKNSQNSQYFDISTFPTNQDAHYEQEAH